MLRGMGTPPVKTVCWGLWGPDAHIPEEDTEAQGAVRQNFWIESSGHPDHTDIELKGYLLAPVTSFRHSWIQLRQ